jgi:hypothetical protein
MSVLEKVTTWPLIFEVAAEARKRIAIRRRVFTDPRLRRAALQGKNNCPMCPKMLSNVDTKTQFAPFLGI